MKPSGLTRLQCPSMSYSQTWKDPLDKFLWIYNSPASTRKPEGGKGTSSGDSVEYQVATPRAPEENGRSCLNGISPSCVGGGVRASEAFERDASGWAAGWALCPDRQRRCRRQSRGEPHLSFKASSPGSSSCLLTARTREAMTAESTLWVVQIEDMEDSKALGSRMIVGAKLARSWAAASDPDDPLAPPITGGDGERRGGCGTDLGGNLSYGLARLGRVQSLRGLKVRISLTYLVPRFGFCRRVSRRRQCCSDGRGTAGGRGSVFMELV